MSLSAIVFCTASQWVFTVVDVMHSPQFALYDFKEQHICVKFCSKLIEICIGNAAFGENCVGKTFEWFLN
jgi:hypothetical protein